MTAAPTTRFLRTYSTATDGCAVAMCATNGETYWLTDLDGAQISEFCANRAQVTIQARRRFGRLFPEGVGGGVILLFPVPVAGGR